MISLKVCNGRVWDDVPTMKPLSGAEYTIWPVIHTTLVQKKLQSVECEEVDHSPACPAAVRATVGR